MRSSSWLVAIALLTGCTDAIEGNWEADVAGSCGRDEFEVESDLTVSGHFYNPADCTKCDYDGTFEDKGDNKFEADIEFDNCVCDGDADATWECTVDDDDDTKAECGLEWRSCADGHDTDWEKDE